MTDADRQFNGNLINELCALGARIVEAAMITVNTTNPRFLGDPLKAALGTCPDVNTHDHRRAEALHDVAY